MYVCDCAQLCNSSFGRLHNWMAHDDDDGDDEDNDWHVHVPASHHYLMYFFRM